MKPLTFWERQGFLDQEIIIPAEYVESIMVPAMEHEIGHAVAAIHHGGRVLGIGVAKMPEIDIGGVFFMAIYEFEDWTIETQCIVKAAGPAADEMYRGAFSEIGARVDLG